MRAQRHTHTHTVTHTKCAQRVTLLDVDMVENFWNFLRCCFCFDKSFLKAKLFLLYGKILCILCRIQNSAYRISVNCA